MAEATWSSHGITTAPPLGVGFCAGGIAKREYVPSAECVLGEYPPAEPRLRLSENAGFSPVVHMGAGAPTFSYVSRVRTMNVRGLRPGPEPGPEASSCDGCWPFSVSLGDESCSG